MDRFTTDVRYGFVLLCVYVHVMCVLGLIKNTTATKKTYLNSFLMGIIFVV
jgi:hypothetical protein